MNTSVTSFGVCFVVCMNKLLSKQSNFRLSEKPWRSCDIKNIFMLWEHSWTKYDGNSSMTSRFLCQEANNAVSFHVMASLYSSYLLPSSSYGSRVPLYCGHTRLVLMSSLDRRWAQRTVNGVATFRGHCRRRTSTQARTHWIWIILYEEPPSSSWWRHRMEIFSALLAFCAGNSPVTGYRWIPPKMPLMRSIDVLFDLRL